MRYILFDLDGTLTDSKEGIFKSAQYALSKLDITPPPLSDMNWVVGPPIRQSFAERYGLSEEDALRGLRFYQERFGKVGYLENRVYPGVAEMLQTLVDAGCTLAVATSKPAFYATRILEHFALDGYFAYISGSEMDGTNGAKSAVVARAMQEIGADPAETAMVGDRRYDMQSARVGRRGRGVWLCRPGGTRGGGGRGDRGGHGGAYENFACRPPGGLRHGHG